jgi:hypothetical protein
MKRFIELLKSRKLFGLPVWPIVLLCLVCIAIASWLIVRPRGMGPNAQPQKEMALQEVRADAQKQTPPQARVLTPTLPGPSSRTLSSSKFRARYSARVERRDVESVLRTLEEVSVEVAHRTETASVRAQVPAPLNVVIHDTTGDFVASTGQPWWAAAVTHDNLIELQPLEILRSRGVLDQTLRHEYAHTVIEMLSHGKAPRWLAEGFAAHIAGEGAMLMKEKSIEQLSTDELERRLTQPGSAEDMRILYAAAYREVSAMIRADGEASVWRRLARS